MNGGKTLLIGLDGMCFALLDHLMDAGVMPFHREFARGGVRAGLMSTPCPVTPPAWTSIMTGASPGNHGIYDFICIDGEITDRVLFRLANARDVRSETIWSIAGRHGRVAASLNFPQMYQASPFGGYMVPGFVTSRYLRSSVQPREFWDRIKDLPGFNVKDAAWDLNEGRKALGGELTKEDFREWIDYLCRKEQSWFAVARELLTGTSAELVAVVFEGMDRLQHQAWHLLDPSLSAAHDTPEDREIRGYCHKYYGILDGLVRELVSLAGEDSRVFIVSDHGFGTTTEIFYVNTWLERRGYLKWVEGIACDGKEMLTAHNMREHFQTIDWQRTDAYARTTSANGVYIRVSRGPGQPGIPPESYGSFRGKLAAELLEYKDPATGTTVVTRVQTREEAFPGRAMGDAPDLTLTLRDGGFVSILRSDEPVKQREKVHGTHRPEGIFIAGGKGVLGGASIGAKTVMDVAPTLLYSMGLPVPCDLEGEAVVEAFDPAHVAANPVRKEGSTRPPDAEAAADAGLDIKGSEEDQILERLKGLGYFE